MVLRRETQASLHVVYSQWIPKGYLLYSRKINNPCKKCQKAAHTRCSRYKRPIKPYEPVALLNSDVD